MGFWETLVADLTSRGGLAGALATFYSLAIVGWWIGHVRLIRRRAERMPIRILVTGTRGKSSVVRLLHAALRHAGYRVSGKTTGTAASAALVGAGVLLAQTGVVGTVIAVIVAGAAITASLVVAVRQLRVQAREATLLGRQVRADYETPSQSSG